jgi:cellulose synthase/poly-beta-1,6-N-acetylglucosamine synthase-like glycosyltransferase
MSSATASVSVIIPTYNRAYCLEQTLQSVFGQSHTRVELIVADDGSIDETGDLCHQMAQRDGRLRYIRQTNAGVSAARNTGIGVATGDYVAFSRFRRSLEAMENRGAACGFCGSSRTRHGLDRYGGR